MNRRILSVVLCFLLCLTLLPSSGASSDDGFVTVSTVDELLSSIHDGARIQLLSGVYDFSSASDYGENTSSFYRWASGSGGYTLTLTNISDLQLDGQDGSILCTPGGNQILSLENCSSVLLRSLTFSNTEEVSNDSVLLSLLLCRDVTLENCTMKGSGISGLSLELSQRTTILNTEFCGCDPSTIFAHQSSGLLISECTFSRNLSGYLPNPTLLTLDHVSSAAMVNSQICNNRIDTMFDLNCSDFYLGGCEIASNRIQTAVFSIADIAPILETNLFSLNTIQRWYSNSTDLLARDVEGTEISRGSTFTGSFLQAVAVPAFSLPDSDPSLLPEQAVHVSTAGEFLDAIAPGATIYLEPGSYDLTAEKDAHPSCRYYYWEECFDGFQLVLQNLDQLSVIGAGRNSVLLSVSPRYANVLSFRYCSEITISSLTAGHTIDGYCTGGVFDFAGSDHISIADCGMFGCGTYGIIANGCRFMDVVNSEIYECSYGALALENSRSFSFQDVTIRDCASPNISMYQTGSVTFNGTDLETRSWDVSPDGTLIPLAYG